MPKRRLGADQIVTKLRQIEVLQAQGKNLAVACKEVGTTEQSYYRWRKEYGGLGVDQAKRFKRRFWQISIWHRICLNLCACTPTSTSPCCARSSISA